MEGIFGIVEGRQGREREWIGAGAAWRASGNEDKMTPHALAKFACFCDKKRSPLKSFTDEFCHGDGGLATEIGQSDAIHSLLRLWPESDHEFRRVLRKSLSSNRVRRLARCRHVELGVIPVLVDLFRVGDSTTKVVAGNSPGVISVHVDYIRLVAEAGAILLYAELLQVPDFIGKEIAEDLFCVLAVAKENAVSIAEHLVRILREGDDESKTVAADVFCDLSDYKHSIHVVRSSGAIPILVNL
ncbi:hypothetical protein EZV62_009378 [Acer yangbiense]|uniref:Uncharacterized protein n=1 Tax=Acer yangbiense TaxID=1000413 RepID=A0A5C7IFU5_9ROSI|nr:hypothetical protein EZV62_009378 [Acer yangbiense]